MNEKDGFAAILRQRDRLLKAENRLLARYKREGRWPTKKQLDKLLAATPLLRSRGDPRAFWRRLTNDRSFKAEGGLPALLGPMLVALAGWCRAAKKRPPFFRRRAQDFVEFLGRRLYLMPLAPMPRGTRSTDALSLPGRISNRTLERFLTRLLKHPERVRTSMDDNPELSLALLERYRRGKRELPRPKRYVWIAHAELVHEVRLLLGGPFYRELAALITAGHRAHGEAGFYLRARVLTQTYRRWLRATPEKARAIALVGHVKDRLLFEILR